MDKRAKHKIGFWVCFFTMTSLANPLMQTKAQCDLVANAQPIDIVCGECVRLSAFGNALGTSVFIENFDGGAPTGWASTSQATYTNPCSPGGADGTTHLWMGSQTGVPREMVTVPFDFTSAIAGASLCFDLLFAEQTGEPADAPCEGPDEPQEGVAVEYSIDGGATWIEVNYFDPNGGFDPALTNWNTWCYQLPPAALTGNTIIRWFQDNDSGADYDHWGIDNVNVYFNDPTYEIIWDHDNYSYGVGSPGGDHPIVVCPQETSTYSVAMSNGISSCNADVTINVTDPEFRVEIEKDTMICAGECVVLDAEATVIVRPAGVKEFLNNDFEAVLTGEAAVNINVQGLNATTIQTGLISEVCVNGFDFAGFFLCDNLFGTCDCAGVPIGFLEQCDLDVGSFDVLLSTPDGCTITLVPSGVASQTYTDVCFVPTGGADINTGTFPTSGNFDPDQALSDLDACASNGVWTLEFDGGGGLSLGFGTLTGWSITFDDPEISYEGMYSWSPNSNMTDANTLTPTVCPTSAQTYTLTVMDDAGCATAMQTVNIGIDSDCCDFTFDALVDGGCGINNGSADVTIIGGSGNFSYDWDSGQMTEDLMNVPSNTYVLTVNDINGACQKDTTIIIPAPINPPGGLIQN